MSLSSLPLPTFLEILGCLAHLLGGAQGQHQHALVVGLDQDRVLALRQHNAADPGLAGFHHGLAQHAERLVRHLPVRAEIICRVEIDRLDLVALDEADEIDRLRGLDLDFVELLLRDDDVSSLLELIAANELAARDLLLGFRIDGAGLDAIMRLGIEKMEVHAFAGRGRGRKMHRTGHERQLEKPLPGIAGRHNATPGREPPTGGIKLG